MSSMRKAFRILAGCLVAGFLLYVASVAVRDCQTGLYVYENCIWLWLRDSTGLPQSKLLRATTLELIGLALLAGLYLTARYAFGIGGAKRAETGDSRTDPSGDGEPGPSAER